MIAALFVATNGCYFGLPDVDPWDIKRDAMLYDGPYPVVAHPPCARWCRMAALVEKKTGLMRGDDGGTFASALMSVRKYGGVLEHPAFSDAWAKFGLPRPPSSGGWVPDNKGGWACHVEQRKYGHRARKATWPFAHMVRTPELRWGKALDGPKVWSGPLGKIKEKGVESMGRKERLATPPEFRDLLISIANSARK